MRKTVNVFLTVAAALTFAFAVDAEDVVAEDAVKDNLSGAELSGGADTASVPRDDGKNAIGVDTVDAADAINTVDNVDTIKNIGAVNTVTYDSSATGKRPPPPKLIDEPPQLSGAYWGFGVGLSVGTMPIFPMWQKHFPDTLPRVGLSAGFAADTNNNRDVAPLRYRVIESPDAFNFALPFSLSLYSIGEKRVFSFTVSFFRNTKEFQSTLSIDSDTAARRIDALERLAYYSASIEAAVRWPIPPVFFSVDGAQQTFLTLALGASPINAFTRESEIQTDFSDGDTRMKAVADSVGKTFAALSGNGLSLSWRIGISVVKSYQSGYGTELGLFYSGAYGSRFYSDGARLTEDHIKTRGVDLNAESVAGGKPLSFLSNQAEFRVTVLVPTKREKNQNR